MKRYQYSLIVQKMTVEEGIEEKIFFKDFHSALTSAADAAIADNSKRVDEMISKSISGLRGVLSPYLSTPLTSDKNDIDRALKDNFQFMMGQFCALSSASKPVMTTVKILESTEFPLHRKHAGVVRKLLKHGGRQLSNAGVSNGKNAGPLYLTTINFSDYSLQPVLHSAIQNYFVAAPDSGYVYISDSIGTAEYFQADGSAEGGLSVMLQWNGTEEMSSAIRGRMKTVLEQFGPAELVLATKTTESGFGATYRLHSTIDLHAHSLGSVVFAVVGDDEVLADAIIANGSLYVCDTVI